MTPPGREFKPPEPVGEPFRADPKDPPPFSAGGERVGSSAGTEAAAPSVPVGPPVAGPPWGHPPTHSPTDLPRYGGPDGQPSGARPPQQPLPWTPDERFARTAMWVGVASIFIFNVVLGPIAMALGVSAMRRGQREMGGRALLLGAVGTVLGILLLVLSAVGVLPSFDDLLRDLRRQGSGE